MMIVGSKEAVAEGKVQMEKALQEFAKVISGRHLCVIEAQSWFACSL